MCASGKVVENPSGLFRCAYGAATFLLTPSTYKMCKYNVRCNIVITFMHYILWNTVPSPHFNLVSDDLEESFDVINPVAVSPPTLICQKFMTLRNVMGSSVVSRCLRVRAFGVCVHYCYFFYYYYSYYYWYLILVHLLSPLMYC